ncbi:MAG: hypothetical protein AAGA30_04460 [Planctomycetota bacterium]
MAQCFENAKQNGSAAKVLFDSAEQFAEQDLAAAVHLRGCWNLGRTLTSQSDALLKRLQLQIQTWPNHESANQANFWLGNLYQTRKNWKSAARAYLNIDFGSRVMTEAYAQLQRSISSLIDSVSKDERLSTRKKCLEAMVDKLGDPSQFDTDFGLKLVMLLLKTGLPEDAISIDDAEKWTQKLLVGSQGRSSFSQQAKAWQVVLMAKKRQRGQGHADDLASLVKELPNDHAVLKISLDGLKDSFDEQALSGFSSIIILLCDKALVDPNVEDEEAWIIEKALANVAGGGETNTIQKLANKYPSSLKIQLAFARSLSKRDDLNLALKTWRRLASQVKKGSDAWYEAKYQIVKLMEKNGQSNEAAKLIKYLEATTAGWNESSWRIKFDAWLRSSGSEP